MEYQTVNQMFHEVCAMNADKTAYRLKVEGRWQGLTWEQQERTCERISRSLIALGVKKGDRVNLLSQTRLEWVQSDFGIMGCGAVTVGIYHSNLPQDCAYIIDHCDAEVIFVENEDQLAKIMVVRADLPKLKFIVRFDGGGTSNGILSWQEFLDKGNSVTAAEFEARAAAVQPEDMAAIVYTSGTTGLPKGVMLTHRNIVFTSESARNSLYLLDEFETLLFLPLAHIFARIVVYFSMAGGHTIAFAEGLDKVADNLKEIRPHFIASVPRIYEKVYTKILTGVQAAGGVKEKLFNWSLEVGRQVGQHVQRRASVPAMLRLQHGLANRLVLKKIQAIFGDRMVWAVSGSAPLNKDIAEFFYACGVLILEGIGMTENTSFTNVNRFDHNKFGSVGPVGPGIEMKLAADGEILYRGDNVMKGYFKNPEATAETIDNDGWLYTGDIGTIDADGFLYVTDRKKDLIITSGGKNIAPQRIERILRTSRYISQVVAYGDKKKYLTALVTLDTEHVTGWAKENGLVFNSFEELAQHDRIHQLIQNEVQDRNRGLASFETVKKIRIIPRDFSIEKGELTPSLKVKRKVVTEKYLSLLEEMYDE